MDESTLLEDSLEEAPLESIIVEVVYALPEEQTLLTFKVKLGSTVETVLNASGILGKYPEIDLNKNKVGLFSKLIPLDHQVRDKDRIEIYRELIADPKEVRKKRAAEGKSLKKGGR